MADDFDFELAEQGTRAGEPFWRIVCRPKAEAAVVWGKVEVEIQGVDQLPRRILYYDEDQVLARTMTFEDFRSLGGRTLPVLMRVQPADRPAESTEVRYEDIRFDLELDEGLFSLRSLQR